jgi:predicted metal-dependent hydrolase
MPSRDPRYLKGIEHFNAEDFFEAHEVWEEWWHDTQGPDRDFIQGLIQVASSYHHLRHGNMRGARLLHDSGVELLAPYGDRHLGLDLKGLRAAFDAGLSGILHEPLERLAGRGRPGPVKIEYARDKAPVLTVEP